MSSRAPSSLTHTAGAAMECLSIPITFAKQKTGEVDERGRPVLKCGFRIGGGIDQDFRLSPHGFTDKGIYITHIEPGSPAQRAHLSVYDKILQCNGYDFTVVTHKKACDYIKKNSVVSLLVARQGVTHA